MDDDDERARRGDDLARPSGDNRDDVEMAPPAEAAWESRAHDVVALPPATDAQTETAPAPMADVEDATVDEREVLFLIANYLEKREESKHAAQALIADLSSSDLLGESVSWDGRPKHATYADYKRRHRDLGPDHLLHILKGALAAKPTARSSTAPDAKANGSGSKSLLLKSRVTAHRKALTPEERKAMQAEIIDKTWQFRRLMRTEALVTRVVRKFDRLVQFLEDSKMESLPADVRHALEESTVASANVTALAADVRAVKQLLQVREEKSTLQSSLYALLERATQAGALQSTARSSRNHLSLLHRREISMRAPPRDPPTHIYSRIRRLKTLNGHLQIPTYCLTYDKTGKFVITGADDRLIKVWSLCTGDLRFTLRGHVGNITDLAVNQSNTLLASSSDDKTVRVWELSTGAPVAVLLGHTSIVNSVRFHPAKNIVVTASDDGHCFCYKLPDIEKFDEVESKEQTAKRLLDQGAYLLTLRPAYSLSHAATRPNVRSNKVLCLTFSRCGNYVVTGGQDTIGRVWDVSALCSSDNQVMAADFRVNPQDTIEAPTQPTDTTNPEQFNNPAVGGIAEAPVQPNQNDASFVAAPAPFGNAPELPPQLDQRELRPEQNVVQSTEVQPQFDQRMEPGPNAVPVAEAIPQLGQLGQPVEQNPVQRPEVRQQPQLAEVQVHHSRQAVVDIEQVTPIREPVALLKGHTGPLTNILFNHEGNKIATASIKDGTARVWHWEKKFKKVYSKVLFDQEHDRDRELEMLYGVSSRKKTPAAVDTLVWTCDDKRLITLHSTKPDSGTGEGDWRQRTRVWDPVTGKLEMTLATLDMEKKHGHVNAVFALDAHPTDWRIVVTAGHDGRVFIWDISEGRILKSFVVTSPEGETVALLDGSFMPTGEGFCLTDRIGRLCIFGTGSGEHLAAAPVQQYFRRDYQALVTDRNFHVIDRETQLAPSLMESGPLTDIFQVDYPHQPPHLLVSRGGLTSEQYEENRRKRIQQCIESETTCKVRHNVEDERLPEEDNYPVALLQPPRTEELISAGIPQKLANGAYRLNGDAVFQAELLRRASWNRRRRAELQTRRRASTTSDERDTSILNVDISSEDDHSDEDFQVPDHRRASRDGDDDEEDDDDEDDDEDDDDSELDEDDVPSDASDGPDGDRLRRRRARQTGRQFSGRGRRLDDENDDDNEELPRLRRRRVMARSRLIGDSDDEDAELQGAPGGLLPRTRSRSLSVETLDSAPDAVVVESNDGVIMGDNTLDKFDTSTTYEDMLQLRRQQQPTGNAASLIVCSFCGEGDDEGFLRLPGEAMGKHPLINGSQRLFVHDQCAIASPLCFNHGGRWYNVTKEIRRGRSLTCAQCKKRGATVGCNLERCPKSYHWKCAVAVGWTVDQIQFFCPEHARRANGQGQTNNGTDPEMQQRLGLTFHREWLQLPSLVGVHPYVPQTGDHVVYFPEGHVEFLKGTSLKQPVYLRQLSRFDSLKCRIVDVKYRFPTLAVYHHPKNGQKAIQCEVTLAILAVPMASFPDLQHEREEKEEGEGNGMMIPDSKSLFLSEAPFFSKYVGVNQYLQPTMTRACERMQIKLLTFSNDLWNFLVLDHIVDAGISGNWKIGQRVRSPMIELNEGLQISSSVSFGTIEGITIRESVANPSIITPWNSLYVRWDADDDDDCFVSPWELEPATAVETNAKRERERQLVSVKFHRSRTLSQAQRNTLSESLAGVMTMEIAKDFVYPVSSAYVDYMVTVANPIDLTKIRTRVMNGYYRQLDAFIADVNLLLENCETYNVSTSPIAQNARSLVSSILTNLQQLFPDFFANRGQSDDNVHQYPPTDFGSNDDEALDVDDVSFEEERQIEDAMTALDDLPPLLSDPEPSDTPTRPTRSTRASVVSPPLIDSSLISDSPRTTRRSTTAAATSTPERRTKRDLAATLASPEPPKSARKRQRATEEPRLLKFSDLMSSLTVEQRQLFEARATDDLLSLLRDFHEALMGADVYDVFALPVTEEIAPGYHGVIENPMDFGTILDSIEKYARFSRYFEDVELVFSNAIVFNTWDSDIGAVVKELQQYSVKFLLDAIGANSKRKTSARGIGAQRTKLDTPPRNKTLSTSKRKRRAISDDDDDEEDGWGSDESGSGDDEDDDDDDEDEDDEDSGESDDDEESEPESDWSGGRAPRRTRLVRGGAKKASKPKGGKKAKKGKKTSGTKKRGRPARR